MPERASDHVEFVWDESKRLINIQKHGIDFLDAVAAFRDERNFEYRSTSSREEARCVLVGAVERRIVAVVYTIRGTTIRIISARAARRLERVKWQGNTL